MLLCANKIRSSTILPTVTFYIGKTDITKFIVLFYQISYDYFQFRQKVWDVSVLCQYDWIDFYFLKLLQQLNKRLLLIPIFWRAAVNELQLLIFLTSSRILFLVRFWKSFSSIRLKASSLCTTCGKYWCRQCKNLVINISIANPYCIPNKSARKST